MRFPIYIRDEIHEKYTKFLQRRLLECYDHFRDGPGQEVYDCLKRVKLNKNNTYMTKIRKL